MAVVGVTHAKVVTVPDDGTSPVGSDEWNAGHVITGLENVDNTSDANKPVSTAQAAAFAAAAANAANASNLTSGTVAAARLPNFTQTGTGAVARTILGKIGDAVNVKDFGAVCDGVTDDLAAINAALAAFDSVALPQGTIKVSGPILMSRVNQRLIGAGRNMTTLVGSSASNPIIQVTGGSGYVFFEIGGLTIDRSAVPNGTGHGISQVSTMAFGHIHDVEVKNQYIGLALTGIGYGVLHNINTNSNYSHGIFLGAAVGGGPLQWNLNTILSQLNNGDGISVGASAGTDLGEPWANITTFGNSGYSIRILGGVGAGVSDVNISGGFMGSDGLGGILIDTYSSLGTVQTILSNLQMENFGNGATGRGLTTPATNSANGITITANNGAVNLLNVSINAAANSGIVTAGPSTTIIGGIITDNGVAGTGNRNGIHVTGGSATILGASIGNDGTTRTQNGIVLDVGSTKNIVLGNNVAYKAGCVVAGIVNNSTNPLLSNIIGNIGYSPMQVATGLSSFTVSNSTAAASVSAILRLDTAYGAFATAIPTIDFTGNGAANQIIGRIGAPLNGDFSGDLVFYVPTAWNVAAVEAFRVVGATGSAVARHPTGGLGYGTGAGGTVAQATSKATGVTLSKASGQITMNAAALAAGTIVSFVLTNTAIAATDVLILNHISGGTPGSYSLNARCAAGSATIDVRNNTAGSLSEAIVIQFALIKAVNA